MPDVAYVPVLKGRQGEFAALAELQPGTREGILPLVEIVPGPDDQPATLRQGIDKSVRRLRPWAGHRLLLDVGLLPVDVALGDDLGVVAFAARRARELSGVVATPVVRLNDEPMAYADAAVIHRDRGGGIAVRLGPEDLEEDPDDVVEALNRALRAVGAGPADVDLVLDFGVVDGELAVHAGARFAADLVRALPTPDDWRELVLVSGAFPTDLFFVDPWRLGEAFRYDAQLYDRLQQRSRESPRILWRP